MTREGYNGLSSDISKNQALDKWIQVRHGFFDDTWSDTEYQFSHYTT